MPTVKQQGQDDTKLSLEEQLFGEAAEATLLSQNNAAGATKLVKSSRGLTLSIDTDETSISPQVFIASYRQNVTKNEGREARLANNRRRQAVLRSELEDFEQEAEVLATALRESKAERKHLRTSLSARDLAFLQAGQDFAHGGAKRLRFDHSDEE